MCDGLLSVYHTIILFIYLLIVSHVIEILNIKLCAHYVDAEAALESRQGKPPFLNLSTGDLLQSSIGTISDIINLQLIQIWVSTDLIRLSNANLSHWRLLFCGMIKERK